MRFHGGSSVKFLSSWVYRQRDDCLKLLNNKAPPENQAGFLLMDVGLRMIRNFLISINGLFVADSSRPGA